MEFNQGGFTPPENNYNNGAYSYTPYNMPKFIPYDVWNREKARIKKLSILAGAGVLLFIVFSSVYVGIYTFIGNMLGLIGGNATDAYTAVTSSNEFLFIFEILYSVFVVGGPFFVLGAVFYKKGLVGTLPMGKPLKAKLLPLVVIAGFGVCLFGNIINSYITLFFEMLAGSELEYSFITETPDTVGGILLFYLSTAVVPALIEEVAMRGIIMQPLRRYGDWFAIICSSLVFGFMHCNLVQIPFAFIAGIVIGYAVIATESIWTGVLIHFMNNAFSVTVSIIYDIYGMDSWQYKLCDAAFYVFMIVGAALAYIVIRKFKDKPMYRSPLINQGRNIFGQVHPYSAKVSNKSLYGAYIFTLPMISAFAMVCIETVITMLYM
ncbi:MAG: CPBP family intramembrane metalloprotease [Clostridia bacterium]|nr:CPBP family intramembrane metalloprotease [Clostridia bacterium]